MPEPLATPVTAALPFRSGTLAIFGRVSVVRMALANPRRFSIEVPAFCSKGFSEETILPLGSGRPMIPVDDGKISDALACNRTEVWRQISLQAAIPCRPVAQFAFPEFTTTARTRPRLCLRDARPTSTGAATIKFFVNSAAALAG